MGDIYKDFNDSLKVIEETKNLDSSTLLILTIIIIIVALSILIYSLAPKIFDYIINKKKNKQDKRESPYKEILLEVKKVRMSARKLKDYILLNNTYDENELKEFKSYYHDIEDQLTKHHLIISENVRKEVHGLKTSITVFHEAVARGEDYKIIERSYKSIDDTYNKVLLLIKKELETIN